MSSLQVEHELISCESQMPCSKEYTVKIPAPSTDPSANPPDDEPILTGCVRCESFVVDFGPQSNVSADNLQKAFLKFKKQKQVGLTFKDKLYTSPLSGLLVAI